MTSQLVITLVLSTLVFAFAWGVLLGYPAKVVEGGPMSAKEQAIVAAAADAFFPRGGALIPSGTDAGAVAYFSTFLAELPAGTRFMIRLLLRLVEHGPWVFGPARRFTRQSPEQRVATLRGWEKSRLYFLRISFQSLRTLIGLAYLGNDGVARSLGAMPNLAPFEGKAS
jgi:hypothetical protein